MNRDYKDPKYREWIGKVKRRDKHCKWPGCKSKKKLQAHHILTWSRYPHLRFILTNGITLCKQHHDMTKHKEEQYAPMFMRIIASDTKGK